MIDIDNSNKKGVIFEEELHFFKIIIFSAKLKQLLM